MCIGPILLSYVIVVFTHDSLIYKNIFLVCVVCSTGYTLDSNLLSKAEEGQEEADGHLQGMAVDHADFLGRPVLPEVETQEQGG